MRTRTRRKSRRQTRGAAFSEAVLVGPCFAVLFCATGWLHDLYAKKLTVLARARTDTMAHAVASCKGDLGIVPGRSATLDGASRPNLPDSNEIHARAPAAERLQARRPFDLTAVTQTQAHASVTGDAAPTIGAGPSKLFASSLVLCNEVPVDPDLSDLARFGIVTFVK